MRPLIEALCVSAAISIVTAVVLVRFVPGQLSRRYAGALGFAIAFVAAYARLESGHLVPTAAWQWTPWMALAGAIVGPVGLAGGVHILERWGLGAIYALTVAWFLVPTRASIQPVRVTYVLGVAACLILFWQAMDQLARRGAGRMIGITLLMTSMNAATIVAYFVSLRIGSLELVAVPALLGAVLTVLSTRDDAIIRGSLPALTVVLCSVLLAAHLADGFPKLAPALTLIAPQTLWLFQIGPQSRITHVSSVIAKLFAVAIPLGLAWCL